MSESKTLVTTGGYSKAELIAMSGTVVGGSDEFLPNLGINKDIEDDEEREVPVPSYRIKVKDKGWVYAGRKAPVTFRPFVHGLRYEKWLNDEKSYQMTQIFQDFRQEIIDELGGTDKLGGKENGARCKHVIMGLVSFEDGVTAEGEEVAVKDVPCILRVGGGKYMETNDVFEEFGEDRWLPQYELKLTPVKSGQAYNTDMAWVSLTDELPVTEADWEIFQSFLTEVKSFNQSIQNKFDAAIKSRNAPSGDKDADDEYKFIEDDQD